MIGWAVRQLLVWGLLGGLAVVLVADRGGVRGTIAAMLGRGTPPAPASGPAVAATAAASRTLVVRAGHGGHFWVEAEIDGATLPFVVDTGATSVTLSRDAAALIGLRLGERDYTEPHRTANGIVRTAPVQLREVRIGALSVRDVDASVNPHLAGVSLLGMSFLKRLDGYEVRGDRLMLYW
jgi:aspartyl protease family protein